MEWVTKIRDSYTKWLDSALVSRPIPHAMLTKEQKKEIHLDSMKATDFLSTIYRVYKDLINVDSNNSLEQMTNQDKTLGKVRRCFKQIKTYVVSNNYFRSISGHPLHLIKSVNLVKLLWNRIVQNT